MSFVKTKHATRHTLVINDQCNLLSNITKTMYFYITQMNDITFFTNLPFIAVFLLHLCYFNMKDNVYKLHYRRLVFGLLLIIKIEIWLSVIGGRQEGHPVQKCSLLQQNPN